MSTAVIKRYFVAELDLMVCKKLAEVCHSEYLPAESLLTFCVYVHKMNSRDIRP